MPSPGVVGGDEEAGRQEAGQHKHEHHLDILTMGEFRGGGYTLAAHLIKMENTSLTYSTCISLIKRKYYTFVQLKKIYNMVFTIKAVDRKTIKD